MARNGSGAYSLPAGNPVVTGTVISSSTMNTTLSDIATALTASIANDGQTVPVANIPMGGFKLTGLGDATVANDAIRYNGALGTPSSGTVTNLTGTASININGTVGSTTPTTGKFTTVTATGGINEARGSIAMHATTMDLWAQPNIIDGTSSAVTITAIANAPQAGARRVLYPVAASVITNGATFAVDGAANATAAAGDAWEFEAITTSTYKVHITKADGTAVSGTPAGTIIDFGGSTAPTGYLACNGAAVSRATYADLFTAIGTLWGAGDGSTTFNIPSFTAGFASVQSAGTVGASTTGQVIAHTHLVGGTAAAAGGDADRAPGNASVASSSTGGTNNLAAGRYVFKCIKT